MNKFTTTAAALAVMGLSGQAHAYSATALVQFDWATGGTYPGWTASAPNSLSTIDNSTYFNSLTGSNSTTYLNADFWDGSQGFCPAPYVAQYACKTAPLTQPVSGVGPGASAVGSIVIGDTTLTGVLTVIETSDVGAGPQPLTTAATGFNVRSADGSPFKNVWYGVSDSATLTLALTGTFTNTSWQVTGGTATFTDPNFQCAFADFSGVLCTTSATTGGFQPDGNMLSWGIDLQGGGVQEITMYDAAGVNVIGTIGGVLADVSVTSGPGDTVLALTTNNGEWRTGSSQGACNTQVRWDGAGISCGTLTTGDLNISVVPVPAAVWLFASALGLMGFARRRLAA